MVFGDSSGIAWIVPNQITLTSELIWHLTGEVILHSVNKMLCNLRCLKARLRLLYNKPSMASSLNLLSKRPKSHNIFSFGMAYLKRICQILYKRKAYPFQFRTGFKLVWSRVNTAKDPESCSLRSFALRLLSRSSAGRAHWGLYGASQTSS